MSEGVEVVGLVGGELVSSTDGTGAREVVLALPLGRLLVRMVRVPSEQMSDVAAYLTPLMQEMSPYPDEPLTVGWETVRESERGQIVLAAALPESSADDVAELLDAQKLRVTRLDALMLGELRALWPALSSGGALGTERRLVLLSSDGSLEMIVLDGDVPSALRSVPSGADFRREAMLCLLEAEDFGGVRPLAEIVTVGAVDASALSVLSPIRSVVPVSVLDSLDAVAARSADPSALDVRPASWREFLEETRFRHKLIRSVSVAVGVWLLAMGVLFGVPMAYGYMTDYQKGLSKRHEKAYRQVCEMKAKVEVVQKYSDHARGALEMMKAVSDRVPAGIELDSWDFKREDGLSFSGLADDPKDVYELKNSLTVLADDAGGRVFGQVRLGRLTAAKGSKQRFALSCRYRAEEEEQ